MKKVKKTKQLKTWPLYMLFIVLFVIYIMVQHYSGAAIVVGSLLFLLLITIIVFEFINGVHEAGYKKNIIEVAIAVLIVVCIWFGLEMLLRTGSPLNVVPSCSMLPALHRGDLVVIEGVSSIRQLKAPVVNMTASQFAELNSSIESEFLECVAYKPTLQGYVISQFMGPGYSIGLYAPSINKIIPLSMQNGIITYTCGERGVVFQNGTMLEEAYTTAITIDGTTIVGDRNNSIIVYKTIPQDSFYKEGDMYIVHRVYAIINASGNYYVLTKGDNNPGLDMQYGNYPIPLKDVEGKVVGVIPYIGYLKLVMSNSLSQPYGCNFTTQH